MTMQFSFPFPIADTVISDRQPVAALRAEGVAGGDQSVVRNFGAEMALFDVDLTLNDPEQLNMALMQGLESALPRQTNTAVPERSGLYSEKETSIVLSDDADTVGPIEPLSRSQQIKSAIEVAHQFQNPLPNSQTAPSVLAEPASLRNLSIASPMQQSTAIKTAILPVIAVSTVSADAMSAAKAGPEAMRPQPVREGSRVSDTLPQGMSKVVGLVQLEAVLGPSGGGHSDRPTMTVRQLPKAGVVMPERGVAPALPIEGDLVNGVRQSHSQPEVSRPSPSEGLSARNAPPKVDRSTSAELGRITASKGETLLHTPPQVSRRTEPNSAVMPSNHTVDASLENWQIDAREVKPGGAGHDSATQMPKSNLAARFMPTTIPQVAVPLPIAQEARPSSPSIRATGVVFQPSEGASLPAPQAPIAHSASTSQATVPQPSLIADGPHTVDGEELNPLVVEGERRSDALLHTSSQNRATAVPQTAATFGAQVREAIGAAGANQRSIEIALKPEELGSVRMTLTASEGGGSVAIMVERPETLELVQRHLEALRRELRDAGWAHSDVFVTQDGPTGHSSDPEAGSGSSGQKENGPSSPVIHQPNSKIPMVHTPQTATSGLDLRI